jgi:hypothetical protein
MTKSNLLFLLPIVAAATAWSAPPQANEALRARPEIRGVVLDPGGNLPIANVEIALFAQDPGPVKINGGWKNEPSTKTTTDDRGQFTFTPDGPGRYHVTAKKPGFVAVGPNGASDNADVALTPAKPTAEVKLYLARPGRLTGTVIDQDTHAPLANLRVGAIRPGKTPGWPAEAHATTDAKGEFAIANVPPGEWLIEIAPQSGSDQRVVATFTDKDAKAVTRDLERTYWPGGHGQDSSLPITLASGAEVYAGQMPVKKVDYYRALVHIQPGVCTPGENVVIYEGIGGMIHLLEQQPPCSGRLLITGFSPGTYALNMGSGGLGGSVLFSIVDKNVEATASVDSGFQVDGAIVAAEGSKLPDLSALRLELRAAVSAVSPKPVQPDEKGKFQFPQVKAIGHTLSIFGLSGGSYVKELRYNGAVLPANVIPLDDNTAVHSLTIVVDNNPGTITGSVTSHDKPVAGALVVARKWPFGGDARWGLGGGRGDDNGKFQVTGLAPGEYRVIAIELSAVTPGMGNASLDRALASGQKVEVGPNGFQNIALELTELNK